MIQVNQSSTWFPYLQGPLGLIDRPLFPHWGEQLPVLHIKDCLRKIMLPRDFLFLCSFWGWSYIYAYLKLREREISSKNIIARVRSESIRSSDLIMARHHRLSDITSSNRVTPFLSHRTGIKGIVYCEMKSASCHSIPMWLTFFMR